MALQLWMPLMGDLRNQGLSSYSISTLGTLSWVAGKLGSQAMRAGDGTQIVNGIKIEDTFTTLLNGNYSVSVWVKPYGQHIHYNGSIFSSGNWNTANKRWAFGVSQDNTKVDVLCMNHNTYINCTVPTNEWTHLVCTCGSDRMVKLYKNGEYVGQRDCSSDPSFDSDATYSCIGRESYASGYFSFNGALQDFRLYDHCLSPMEVKQLSQGLVLHYPLNRQGWGQENLVRNSNQFKTGGHASGVTPSVEADGTYKVIAESGNSNYSSSWWWEMTGIEDSFVEDETFTVSFWIKSSNANKTKPPTIYLKSGMGYYSMQGSVSANYSQVYYTGTWKKTNSLAPHLGWSGLVGTYYICYWKIEKGSIPTPWCPNSTDTLATTMGLNSNIEYDCSGYCNNGTRNATFTWTSNASKYEVSTVFDGNTNAIQTPNLTTMVSDRNYTIACWVYKSVLGSKNYQTIYGGPSGFELEARNGTAAEAKFRIHNWGGGSTAYEFNTWYHFCFVHTASDSKLYINGELKLTGSSAAVPSGNYFVGAWKTATQQNYDGLISDFRIYATALSADDVLSLYQNSAYIDSSGNVYGTIHEV